MAMAGERPMCSFPGNCFNMNCGKAHTADKCPSPDACQDFHCPNRHSKQRPRCCHSGNTCRKPDCTFLHPRDRQVPVPAARAVASPQQAPQIAQTLPSPGSKIIRVVGFGPHVHDFTMAAQKLQDALTQFSRHQVIVDIPNRANVRNSNAQAFAHFESCGAAQSAAQWINAAAATGLDLGALKAEVHCHAVPASTAAQATASVPAQARVAAAPSGRMQNGPWRSASQPSGGAQFQGPPPPSQGRSTAASWRSDAPVLAPAEAAAPALDTPAHSLYAANASDGQTCRAVVVGGFDQSVYPWSFQVAENKLGEVFSRYGCVQHVELPAEDTQSNPPRRLKHPQVAFIQYSLPAEAAAAVAQLHGYVLYGQKLTVRLQSTPVVEAVSNRLFVSGFKAARWSFDYAASVLGDWLRSEGFPAESIGCPDINGKAEPMPFAIFAFVDMVSEDVAAKAKQKLNMTKLLGHTMLIQYRLKDHPIADPAAATQYDRSKPVCRGNPIIMELQGDVGPEGQTLRTFVTKHALGKQNQHHCQLARQMWQVARDNKITLYTDDFMQSGRVHLFPSMVEANTAMYLKKLSDMLQAIFDSLSQEASSEGEFVLTFWSKSQWAFVQRYRLPQLKMLPVQHRISLVFRGGQTAVQGMKMRIVPPQVEDVLKTALGIRTEDWRSKTVTVLDTEVSPVSLLELANPAHLKAFEHKAVQDVIQQAEALGQVLLVQNSSKLKPGVLDIIHIWGLDQRVVDSAVQLFEDMVSKLSHSMLSVPAQQLHQYTAAVAGMTTQQGFVALMTTAQQSVLLIGLSELEVNRGLAELKQAVHGHTSSEASVAISEAVCFELQTHHQQSLDSVCSTHHVTYTCTNQDGKTCLTLAGEQRRLPAAHDAMLSVLNAIKANLITDRLQLHAWESAVFKQQALAAIGNDMLEQTRRTHGVWCAADMPDCADAPAGVDGANGFQASQPQQAVHAVAQVYGHTVEVVHGNLVKQHVEAIVNAANQRLQHNGGVARAIAEAAGPALAADCAALLANGALFPTGCIPVGSAVRTDAGVMLCKSIIHAVAPVYQGGLNDEETQLQHAVAAALDIACVQRMESVALPLIGTGVYGNPTAMAARVHVAQVLAVFNALQTTPGTLKVVKFVEADVQKCKALASELLRQTGSTPNYGQAVPSPPHVTVAPDAADFVNGQAWGIHDVQKNEDIEYGIGASCVLERQYMQFNQLGSAEKERSPFRYYEGNFDSDKYRSGTDYSVDLLKMEQTNVQTKYVRQVWRRSVAAARPAPRAGPAGDPAAALRGLHMHASGSAAQGQGLPGPSSAAGLVSANGVVDAASTSVVFIGRQTALPAAKHALQVLISDRQREIDVDLGLLPTLEELTSIRQADCMFNVRVTDLGSGCMKVLGDIGTMQQVQQHMQVVMSRRHVVRWPDHWAPQSSVVEVFNVLLDSDEAKPLLAAMQGEGQVVQIERIQNRKLYQHYSGYKRQVQDRWAHIPGLVVEQNLWHGSTATDPSLIFTDEYGFRLNFASPGMWGRGCYFSVTANLSCQNYAYSMPAAKAVAYGGKDVSQVMLVKVLVGSAYHSSPDKSLKIPPLVQDIPEHLRQQGITQLRFESVSGTHPALGGTPIYITYNVGHGYPEYLVTFIK